MAMGRISDLGAPTFRDEDEYRIWTDNVQRLIKDFSRELEDAGDLLQAVLKKTPVLNLGDDNKKSTIVARKIAAWRHARQIGKALRRASASVHSSRKDVAVAWNTFATNWTRDGGLGSGHSSSNGSAKDEGMKLNGQRSRRKVAA